MSAAHLLHELRTLGVRVWPDAGALRFKAPVGAMTPELTARLKVAKPELLALLSSEPIDTEPAPDLPLLAALAEFDALIDRLCAWSKHPPAVREEMRRIRFGMAACNVPREIEVVRELVKLAESRTANHPPEK